MSGAPLGLLQIIISLKFITPPIPVPSALENASFAANFLDKKLAVIFFVFFLLNEEFYL